MRLARSIARRHRAPREKLLPHEIEMIRAMAETDEETWAAIEEKIRRTADMSPEKLHPYDRAAQKAAKPHLAALRRLLDEPS